MQYTYLPDGTGFAVDARENPVFQNFIAITATSVETAQSTDFKILPDKEWNTITEGKLLDMCENSFLEEIFQQVEFLVELQANSLDEMSEA